MVATCPSTNFAIAEQEQFFINGGINWSTHVIGWVVAGSCAIITTIISLISVMLHACNYTKPKEQRQIIRILFMPLVWAVVAFFSYRFFRTYIYYSLIEAAYEAIAIAAFLILLIQYVLPTRLTQEDVLKSKDKLKLPFPFWFLRYRASKPYFMHALKWSVLQYVLVRPSISVAAAITQYFDVYCVDSMSPSHAQIWLTCIDFVSISVALYGLVVMYTLTRSELKGKGPLAKFICIKLIVSVTFFQGFIFAQLASRGYIKETQYWTGTNISDGLNALCICVEMVIFSIAFFFAYSYRPYNLGKGNRTNPIISLLNSFNYADFLMDIFASFVFFKDWCLRRPYTKIANKNVHDDFSDAFVGRNQHDATDEVAVNTNTKNALPMTSTNILATNQGNSRNSLRDDTAIHWEYSPKIPAEVFNTPKRYSGYAAEPGPGIPLPYHPQEHYQRVKQEELSPRISNSYYTQQQYHHVRQETDSPRVLQPDFITENTPYNPDIEPSLKSIHRKSLDPHDDYENDDDEADMIHAFSRDSQLPHVQESFGHQGNMILQEATIQSGREQSIRKSFSSSRSKHSARNMF